MKEDLQLYLRIKFGNIKRLILNSSDQKKYVDLCGSVCNPIDVFKRADEHPVLIQVPMNRIRGMAMMGFPCNSESNHPYIMTVKNGYKTYDGSPLQSYHKLIQPKNAAELFGIDGNEKLRKIPTLWGETPWRGECGKHVKERRIKGIQREGIYNGVFKIDSNDGWHIVGPVSNKIGRLDIRRLFQLTDSISKKGYIPNSRVGHITGSVFIGQNEDWSFYCGQGQHRLAVCAALGYTSVPVLIKSDKIVRRSDVNTWPGVKKGYFSKEEALQVFDRIHSGRQPEWVKARWPRINNNLL